MNADIRDGPQTPTQFTSIPGDLPATFVTGADILDWVTGVGLPNDPFAPLTERASMVDAQQVDSNYATRPESGRRLDYLFASDGILTQGAQVFDCADEGLAGSLPLSGDPLAAETCPLASDHLPVFADLLIPTLATPCPPDGHLVVANQMLSGKVAYACQAISLGPNLTVTATGVVELVAQERITLGPGVSIQAGATLKAMVKADQVL